MEWSWNWSFWRREVIVGPVVGSCNEGFRAEPRSVEDWEAGLIGQGVSSESASRIASRLELAYAEFGRGSAAALIRGAAQAVGAQAIVQARVERAMRDVREVERLLGAFSGELEKLDEVLEVLAAYALKMRCKGKHAPHRTLH